MFALLKEVRTPNACVFARVKCIRFDLCFIVEQGVTGCIKCFQRFRLTHMIEIRDDSNQTISIVYSADSAGH